MPFHHLRTIPGNAWPGIPLADIAQLWAVFMELEHTQWLTPTVIEASQLVQVRSLLSHCTAHVPYYQEMLSTNGIQPADIQTLADFRRLPLLQRRTYLDQFPRFQARSLPPGDHLKNRVLSAGASGTPIEVWRTNLVNLWWFAFHLRDFAWCEFDTRGSLAVIRTLPESTPADKMQRLEGFKKPHWSGPLNQLVENGPAFIMDVRQEPAKQLQWLRRVQPDYLLSLPPNLEKLANLVQESGQRLPSLRRIQATGSTLTAEMKARIEAGFGVPVKNSYTCAEAGHLACSCPAGHGLHVHAESVLLEVLDDAGQPCAPGQTGRVVLTTLQNFATPFIRYDILDRATVGPSPCPCGRGLPLLTGVASQQLTGS